MSDVKIITRAQWGARDPRGGRNSLRNDPLGTTFHWEGPHMGTPPHSECASVIRGIQNFHMDKRGWSDIAYNFLICQHGFVYEGRGVGVGSAANGTSQANEDWYAVCFVTGVGDLFTAEMKTAGHLIHRYLVEHGADDETNGHRDHKSTTCPGDPIYGWAHSGAPAGDASAPAPTLPNPPKQAVDDVLSLYDHGPAVEALQRQLNDLGFDLVVDGKLGPITEKAVEDFQRAAGITIDGKVGSETRRMLKKVPRFPGYTRHGDQSHATGAFQRRLRDRGWRNSKGRPLVVDDDHGDETTRALTLFQKEKGLKADGVGGPITWIALWTRSL